MSNSAIIEFFGLYMDRMLSAAQEAELVELLRDPAAQREWRLLATLDAKLYEEFHGVADILPEPPTIRWTRWIPLAAAAAIVVALGTWFLRPGGPSEEAMYAMGQVVKATGPLSIEDLPSTDEKITILKTPAGSVCRLDRDDGTIVAVAENSDIRWSENLASGMKQLGVNEGQAYLDVSRQDNAFRVGLNSMVYADIQGTRLWARKIGSEKSFGVLDGRVRIYNAGQTMVLSAGQSAILHAGIQGGYHTLLQSPGTRESLSWIDGVGLDSGRVLSEPPGLIKTKSSMLDLSRALVSGPAWRIDRKGDGLVVSQENPARGGDVLFGDYTWLSGEFSCKVRITGVIKTPAMRRKSWIGVVFGYSQERGADILAPHEAFEAMLAKGREFNMQVKFKIDETDDTLRVSLFEILPVGSPEEVYRLDEWIRTPANAPSVKKREACNLGIAARGCTAEFYNMRLEKAVKAAPGKRKQLPGL